MLRAVIRSKRASLGAVERFHIDSRGRKTPYLVLGTPRMGTLVWIHGFSDSMDTFLATAKRLGDRYRVIIPALPGFGGFIDPTMNHSFDAYGAWAVEFLDDVVPGRFHLAGNSLGGATSLFVSAARPERVDSMVLVCSAGVRPPDVRAVYDEVLEGKNLFAVRNREDFYGLRRRVMAKPMQVPALIDAHLFHEQRNKADWYERISSDLGLGLGTGLGAGERSSVVDLSTIDVRTLVLWGELDSLFPTAIGEHIARSIPGAKLRTMIGVGHAPHMESARELADILGEFASAKPVESRP